MAFPASGGSREQLADVLKEARDIAANIKRRTQSLTTSLAASNYSARGICQYMDDLKRATDRLDQIKAVPGMAAYVQEQYSDATIDIVAEFNTMQATIDAVTDWINTNIPKDGTGYILVETIVDYRITARMLSPAQTAPLVAELETLLATID